MSDSSTINNAIISIDGMTCTSCSTTIENGLKDIPGINVVNVSVTTNRASVEYDSKVINIKDIVCNIESLGYGASVLEVNNISNDYNNSSFETSTLDGSRSPLTHNHPSSSSSVPAFNQRTIHGNLNIKTNDGTCHNNNLTTQAKYRKIYLKVIIDRDRDDVSPSILSQGTYSYTKLIKRYLPYILFWRNRTSGLNTVNHNSNRSVNRNSENGSSSGNSSLIPPNSVSSSSSYVKAGDVSSVPLSELPVTRQIALMIRDLKRLRGVVQCECISHSVSFSLFGNSSSYDTQQHDGYTSSHHEHVVTDEDDNDVRLFVTFDVNQTGPRDFVSFLQAKYTHAHCSVYSLGGFMMAEQWQKKNQLENKKTGRMFLFTALCTVPLILIVEVFASAPAMSVRIGGPTSGLDLFGLLLWLLSSLVQFVSGYSFHRKSIISVKSTILSFHCSKMCQAKSLKDLYNCLGYSALGMDFLVSTGTWAAYLYSLFSLIVNMVKHSINNNNVVYFETSAVLIFVILFGKILEARAKGVASSAIQQLSKFQPSQARLVIPATSNAITDAILCQNSSNYASNTARGKSSNKQTKKKSVASPSATSSDKTSCTIINFNEGEHKDAAFASTFVSSSSSSGQVNQCPPPATQVTPNGNMRRRRLRSPLTQLQELSTHYPARFNTPGSSSSSGSSYDNAATTVKTSVDMVRKDSTAMIQNMLNDEDEGDDDDDDDDDDFNMNVYDDDEEEIDFSLSGRQLWPSDTRLNSSPPSLLQSALTSQTGDHFIEVSLIHTGDVLRLLEGEVIPADGVLQGNICLDESMMTGESKMIYKTTGQTIYGGTVVLRGTATMVVTECGDVSTLGKIVTSVQEAQSSKPQIQEIGDKVARYFVPLVTTISILTFAIWTTCYVAGLVPVDWYNDDSSTGGSFFLFAFMFTLAVWVSACPCAFGLATPMAILVSTGVGAKHGILIRKGAAIQHAAEIDVIAFDKTGTLTQGKTEVTDFCMLDSDEYITMSSRGGSGTVSPLKMRSNLANSVDKTTESNAQGVAKSIGLFPSLLSLSPPSAGSSLRLLSRGFSPREEFINCFTVFPSNASTFALSVSDSDHHFTYTQLLKLILSAEIRSNHPLSIGIVEYCKMQLLQYNVEFDMIKQSFITSADTSNIEAGEVSIFDDADGFTNEDVSAVDAFNISSPRNLNQHASGHMSASQSRAVAVAESNVDRHIIEGELTVIPGQGVQFRCLRSQVPVFHTSAYAFTPRPPTTTPDSPITAVSAESQLPSQFPQYSTLLLGSPELLTSNGITLSNRVKEQTESLRASGKIVVLVSLDGRLVAIMGITDAIRPEANLVINQLLNSNIQVVMITGDEKTTADTVGAVVGIPQHNIYSKMKPTDKESLIVAIQKLGKKVAFVGDGTNDSPALARAHLGVAMSSGTTIAIEAGDIILCKNDLTVLLTALELARVTIRRIHINYFWAFGYNMVLIPIAAGIFFPVYHFALAPVMAGAAMALSSVSITLSSLLLLLFKPSKYTFHPHKSQSKYRKAGATMMKVNTSASGRHSVSTTNYANLSALAESTADSGSGSSSSTANENGFFANMSRRSWTVMTMFNRGDSPRSMGLRANNSTDNVNNPIHDVHDADNADDAKGSTPTRPSSVSANDPKSTDKLVYSSNNRNGMSSSIITVNEADSCGGSVDEWAPVLEDDDIIASDSRNHGHTHTHRRTHSSKLVELPRFYKKL